MARKFEFDSGILNGGINNADDPMLIERNQLADGQNVILDDNGYVEKRPPITTNTTPDKEWKTGIQEGDADFYAEKVYTFKKSTGAHYFIAFGGQTVRYSQNLATWTTLNPTGVLFSTTQRMNFITFADKLICSNGTDDVYYWDGTMAKLEKVGAPVLTLGDAGSVTDGVHKFIVTYEAGGQKFKYDVYSYITVTDSKRIELSNIPLCSDDLDLGTRKVWVTANNGDTYYLLNGAALNDTATTATFNTADAGITGWEVCATGDYLSVKVPRCRFMEVYENRLFMAHSTSAPSEFYWSEAASCEDFKLLSVQGVDISDGEYITAIRKFTAGGQLCLWKKSAMYGIYAIQDGYTIKQLSNIGCTFSDSPAEFHIQDEYGERSSMLFANKDGIWEWTGSTNRLISNQPNGSSVQKIWKTVKQREAEFQKYVRTTTDNFNEGSIAGDNNWLEIDEGQIRFKNIFSWTETGNAEGIDAYCWDNKNKRIWSCLSRPGFNGQVGYYEWSETTNNWGTFNFTIGGIGTGEPTYGGTVKMEYDETTDRVYGITSGGSIWRTQNGDHALPYSEDSASSQTFTTTSLTGTGSISVVRSSSSSGTIYLTVPIYADYTATIAAPAITTVLTHTTSGKTTSFTTGQTKSLTPGKYSITGVSSTVTLQYSLVGNVDMKITNGRLYWISHETENWTNFTGSGWSTTQSSSKKNVYYFILAGSGWGSPGQAGNLRARGYTYFGEVISQNAGSGSFLCVSASDETSGYTSFIKTIDTTLQTINATFRSSTTHEIRRHREYMAGSNDTRIICEGLNISDGNYYIGRTSTSVINFDNLTTTVTTAATTSVSVVVASVTGLSANQYIDIYNASTGAKQVDNIQITAINSTTKTLTMASAVTCSANAGVYATGTKGTSVTMYNNTALNIPIMYNSAKSKFYFINNADKKFYETSVSSTTNTDLDLPASATTYYACVLVSGIADGVPDQIVAKPGAAGNAYWRGIIGSYTLSGNWLATNTGTIDCGANANTLLNLTCDDTNATENSNFKYYLYISEETGTIAAADFIQITPEQELESIAELSLKGNKRYAHQYLTGTFDVNAEIANSASASFTGARPAVEGLILNWIDYDDDTNIPKTEIAAIGHKNYYYVAVTENKGAETSTVDDATNNVILVLDKYKRWTIWRGRGCHAASFTVYKDDLYWSDCKVGGTIDAPTYSNYVFTLGNKTDDSLADTDVDTYAAPQQVPIDAYYTTKNYDAFAQYDDGGKKKQLRRLFITNVKFKGAGTYNLTVGYRRDEAKYTESDGTNVIGDDKFTNKTMNVADPLLTGKINTRLDFPNEQPGKRYQFKFSNNTLNQDLAMIKFILTGYVLHRRD